MDIKELPEEASKLQTELFEIRRRLHRHPEVGFDLVFTKALVKEKLIEYGYEPVDMGKAGVVALCGGISTASCEQYHITVHGKGGHGSVPHETIDPITAAAHIHLALAEINSREIDGHDYGVFTTGRFEAGQASNVIPDKAEMWGTIRTITADAEHTLDMIEAALDEKGFLVKEDEY